MSEELKPCPFCGGEAILNENVAYPNGEVSPAFIRCSKCGLLYSVGHINERVVRKWNTRPIEAAREADIQALYEQNINPLRAHVNELEAEREKLHAFVMAFGMLTTLKPDELMDVNNPVKMAEKIINHIYGERARVAELEGQKNGAYSERDRLVSALSKHYPASLERHPENEEWEDDWRWIVYIDLPTGQASWHIHDSELPLFDHLPRLQGRKWDGHTAEEKYERVSKLEEVERWISVSDHLPGNDRHVLVKCRSGYITKGWNVQKDYWWVYDDRRNEFHPRRHGDPVIEWRELGPESGPNKEENHG
jgi:Lar family restriction alleviation protein